MIVWHVKAIKHNNKMVDVTPAAKQPAVALYV
jgi:hypothetical protein